MAMTGGAAGGGGCAFSATATGAQVAGRTWVAYHLAGTAIGAGKGAWQTYARGGATTGDYLGSMTIGAFHGTVNPAGTAVSLATSATGYYGAKLAGADHQTAVKAMMVGDMVGGIGWSFYQAKSLNGWSGVRSEATWQAAGLTAGISHSLITGNDMLDSVSKASGFVNSLRAFQRVCFAAGTPLLTPEGSKPIEQFRVGDLLLSRNEFDPEGPVEPKTIEEVFVRLGRILHLHVGGQVIRTTAEHPFFAYNKGWTPAAELRVGDKLLSHDSQWMSVEDLLDTGEYETVYNLRIADFHTYFVGCGEWGFSVWAHNAYRGELPKRLDELEPGFAVPYGFKDHAEYKAFVARLRAGLPEGVEPVFQGSSVTGRKYKTTDTGREGDAFDFGRKSDFDIGLVHKGLFDRAAATGLLRTKQDPPRIGPIKLDSELAGQLGLNPVLQALNQMSGRKVEFNLYGDPQDVVGHRIYVPGGAYGGSL